MNMESDNTSGSRRLQFLNEKEKHRSEFVVAVIVNAVLLYIFNNLLNWHLSFIAPNFTDVLGILNLFLTVAIIVNFIFIFYHPHWFRNLLLAVPDVLEIMTAYTLLVVFPFVLGSGWSLALKILLVLIIVGTVIALVMHLLRFAYNVTNR